MGLGFGGYTSDTVVGVSDQTNPAPERLDGPVKDREVDVGEQG
jgi:hypothetical protein